MPGWWQPRQRKREDATWSLSPTTSLACHECRKIREDRSIFGRGMHLFVESFVLIFVFLLFFFHLTYSRWTSSLPFCLWSQRIFPSLPGSRLTIFLSQCKFSTLTTRQPMVGFYLLTFPRFPLRKKEHVSYFGKNRTHDFRTSRCAAYLLDHSGDYCIIYLSWLEVPRDVEKFTVLLLWLGACWILYTVYRYCILGTVCTRIPYNSSKDAFQLLAELRPRVLLYAIL